jgi:hypothetical protein
MAIVQNFNGSCLRLTRSAPVNYAGVGVLFFFFKKKKKKTLKGSCFWVMASIISRLNISLSEAILSSSAVVSKLTFIVH